MSVYWVTLDDNKQGSVAAHRKPKDKPLDAWIEESLGAKIVTLRTLPYAAAPLLLGDDICLCYSPHYCAGRTSCPKTRACSE